MTVEAPKAGIFLGSCLALDSQGAGTQLQPLLRDPADVKVTVTSSSAKVHAAAVSDGEYPTGSYGDVGNAGDAVGVDGETTTQPGSRHGSGYDTVGVGVHDEEAGSKGAQGSVIGADDSPRTHSHGVDEQASAANGEQRSMRVRLRLPQLSFSLTPSARAVLTGCIGGNILVSGFHGEVSENFPLDGSFVRPKGCGSREEESEGSLSPTLGELGLDDGVDSERQPAVHPTLRTIASASEDGSVVVACATCAVVFDELVARHWCSWCGDAVCTQCLHTQVRV